MDILNYRGDAGLGLGSNPDINVPVADNRVINDTMRNLMLLDNEKNIKLWQQKVKDRDQLEALILNNQVSTGEIDPKDQKYFDKQKDDVEKAYDAWGGNFNDTAGFRKYQAAVTGLQNTATHAQTRWAGIKQLQSERAKQTLPSKIKEYDDWISKQESQPFGTQVVPFQNMHSWSMNDVLDQPPPIKGKIIDPNSTVSYDTETVDYGDILKKKKFDYFKNGDVTDSIDKFIDQFLQYDQPRLKETIASTDAKIDQYNRELGLSKGQPGFVDHVKVHKHDDGTVTIEEPKTDLAAKLTLANNEHFIKKTPYFNKDILKGLYDQKRLGLEAERNRILAYKAGIEAKKADAYVKHLTAATKQIVDKANQEGTDISGEYNSFVDHLSVGRIKVSTGGKETGRIDAVFMDELPGGFQYINGPVVDSKGKVTAGKLIPFVGSEKTKKDSKGNEVNAGRPYYIPQYVDPSDGSKLDLNKMPSDMQQGYGLAKKATGISKEDYVKILLKKGILELQLQGQNGTANYTSLAQSAKVINNAASKKGQENVMNPPEEAPDAPEEQPAPENPDNN